MGVNTYSISNVRRREDMCDSKRYPKDQRVKTTCHSVFKHNSVPFSRVQYYRYCRTLQKRGEEGLRDKRKDGNYTKLTERIKDYIVSTVKENRSISSSQVQSKILNQFDAKISGFRSIDEKIQGKDFSAMNVFKMPEETISRHPSR